MIDYIEKNHPPSPERDAHLSNARSVLAARAEEEWTLKCLEKMMRKYHFEKYVHPAHLSANDVGAVFKAPTIRRSYHANSFDNRSRYRKVSVSYILGAVIKLP